MFQREGISEARFWKGSFVLKESEPQCFVESHGEAILKKKGGNESCKINNLDDFVNKRNKHKTFKFITEPSLDPTQISPRHLAHEVSAWQKISAFTPILPEVYRHQSVPKITPRPLEKHNQWGAFQVHVYDKHKFKLGLEASFCSCVSAKFLNMLNALSSFFAWKSHWGYKSGKKTSCRF